MTARIRLDDLNSADLDHLYDELDRLQALVEHLGITGPEAAPPIRRWQVEGQVNGRWGTMLRDIADRDLAVDSYRRRSRDHPNSTFRLIQRATTSTIDDPDTPAEPATEATGRCLWCGTGPTGKGAAA